MLKLIAIMAYMIYRYGYILIHIKASLRLHNSVTEKMPQYSDAFTGLYLYIGIYTDHEINNIQDPCVALHTCKV